MGKNNQGGDPNPQPNPNPEPTPQPGDNPVLDKFEEIKNRYESELSKKDEEIQKLKDDLKKKEKEVDDNIKNLNDEVNDKLAKAEELQKLQATVDELLADKAEAIVDKYIQQGKLAPAQKEKALNLCLRDQDMFIDLYENAPTIIDVGGRKSKKAPTELAGQLTNYLK